MRLDPILLTRNRKENTLNKIKEILIMSLLRNLITNIKDSVSSKTLSERKNEILNAAKDVEYYAMQIEKAALKFTLTGEAPDVGRIHKDYEKTINKFSLNIMALERENCLDTEIEVYLNDTLGPVIDRYNSAVLKLRY